MTVFLEILAVVFLLAGIAGCVIPLLPGPPLCFVGLLIAWWAGAHFTTAQILVWLGVAIVVTLIDNFLPVWMTKRFGGSDAAKRGSLFGIIVGFFAGPVGIVLGPFFGALIGELIHDRNASAKAFKVAFGSFAAFICGTGLKLAASIYMAIPVIKFIFNG